MLGVMRKNAGSWVVKLVLGAIALVFALSFGMSSLNSHGSAVIKVNGEGISAEQLDREAFQLMENYRAQFGPEASRLITQQQVTEQAQARLIGRMLLRQATSRLGISTSKEELRPYIESIPAFQQNGVFNFTLYQQALAGRRMTPEMFEADMQQSLNEDKLQAMINSSVFVTDGELDQFVAMKYTRVKGAYLLFQAKDYVGKVSVSQAEKEAFYQEHTREFMEPAKISFAYLNFTDQAFMAKIIPSDDELLRAYEVNIQRFVQPESLTVRSIALQLPPKADEKMWQQTRERANGLLQEAQAPGSDFAALAKRYDQSPASRAGATWQINAQDLDVAMRDRLVATKPGQIALLEMPEGFMIMKVETYNPAKVKPIEDVKGQLQNEIKASLARHAAEDAANKVLLSLRQGKTLAEAAAESGAKVENSALLSADDNAPAGLPPMAEIWESLQGLKPGQAGLPVGYSAGVLLPVLSERVEAQQKTLAQVEQQVTQALTNQKALALANAAAENAIAELKAATKPSEAVLAKPGVKRIGPMLPNEEISALPGAAGMLEALFNATPAAPVVAKPIPVLEGIAAAVLLDRVPPSAEEKSLLKEAQRQILLNIKREDTFVLFMQDQHDSAKIEILR